MNFVQVICPRVWFRLMSWKGRTMPAPRSYPEKLEGARDAAAAGREGGRGHASWRDRADHSTHGHDPGGVEDPAVPGNGKAI